LLTSLGDLTWPVVRDLVDSVITVTESEIKIAYQLILERMKCLIEPSAAVGAAVALGSTFKERYPDLRAIGVILCGGKTYISFFNLCVCGHLALGDIQLPDIFLSVHTQFWWFYYW